MSIDLLVTLSLFVTGFLYASVGHGGASGYLAVLSLWSIPVGTYKPIILLLNILVAGMAFIQFSRAGYFRGQITWPFLLTSLPMAFIGSQYQVDQNIYNLLLGLALLISVIRLLGIFPDGSIQEKKLLLGPALLIGAGIGFLSGILSIGGGIFLSPILILLAWASAKEAAAASSLFIILNSASGLLGHPAAITVDMFAIGWFLAAAAGGFAGAWFGSHRFTQLTVRYMLTGVLTIASCKLIFFM